MGVDAETALRWRRAFGLRLRELRTVKGLSQMALAHEVGLHPTYISGIERGERNVSLVNIHVLASGLGIEPQDMFTASSK